MQLWYFTDHRHTGLYYNSVENIVNVLTRGYKYECSIGIFYRYVMLSWHPTQSWFSACCINVLLHRFSTDLLRVVEYPCCALACCPDCFVHFGTNHKVGLSNHWINQIGFWYFCMVYYCLNGTSLSDVSDKMGRLIPSDPRLPLPDHHGALRSIALSRSECSLLHSEASASALR